MTEDDITPIESGKKRTNISPFDHMSVEAKKVFWDNVFQKLTESDRFLQFVDANYVVGFTKDDEAKTFEINVIEKPHAVGPKLSGEQVFKLQVACTRSGAKDPVALLNSILRLLGQEPKSSIITTADEAELRRAVAEADAQEQLKKGLDD